MIVTEPLLDPITIPLPEADDAITLSNWIGEDVLVVDGEI
jgi:hypothetical protein